MTLCAASWLQISRVVDSNRKLYIAHEIRKLFGLDFTCVDVTDIIETGIWNKIILMIKDHKSSLKKRRSLKNDQN